MGRSVRTDASITFYAMKLIQPLICLRMGRLFLKHINYFLPMAGYGKILLRSGTNINDSRTPVFSLEKYDCFECIYNAYFVYGIQNHLFFSFLAF